MNADGNGAVNVRRKITRSPPTGDMRNGWLAQPELFPFDRESGRVTPREQGNCKPYSHDARVSSGFILFIVTVYRWFAGTGRRTTGTDLQ
jgi:hypothetical protein